MPRRAARAYPGRRPRARAGPAALVLGLLAGAGGAGAATCLVPSAPYATLARALADPTCTTVDLGTGIFDGQVVVPRTMTFVGDGTVQTILSGPVIARGAGIVVTLRELRIDGTQPASSGCAGPALLVELGARAEAPAPTVVTDAAVPSGPCTLFADGFESGTLNGWIVVGG